MTVKHKCSGTVYDPTGFHPCFRNATVQHDDKWYCWQHDPSRVESDKEKRRARWQAMTDRVTANWKRNTRNAKLAALVTPELVDLLDGMTALAESTEIQVPTLLQGPMLRMINDAHTLAARIREALAQEVNDAKSS